MPEEENKESKNEGKRSISRRDFALSSMVVLGAVSGSSDAAPKIIPQTDGKIATQNGKGPRAVTQPQVSPVAKTINITVNKWKYALKVEPESVLRDVLREQLGFLSIKDMCNGFGACGSCAVIMNGRPILSCMTLAIECDGVTIETAEGVADVKPDLIEAYVLNHCMQCGYCTPGFVVTAKALLDRIPKPTEKDIRDALGGNICRCGTYPQHLLAIKEAIEKSA
jgi:aerobic-type carbon monoxide dehydrogenase small subunit (CoxS/CutS family)